MEKWHDAGTNVQQNVFDDFIAAAEYLISSKHTPFRSFCHPWGSKSGLLKGATMTQRQN
jgi:prolyl oligopeptidase